MTDVINSPLLEVRDLCKRFGGVHAVDHVNFSIYPGELVGIIGPNGSGKSTTVNLISGVYSMDAGDVLFDGQVINNLTVPARAQLGISRTFQTPKPFVGTTVFDSVYTAAMQKHSMKDARCKTEEILAITGLSPLAGMRSEKLPIEKRKWLDLARILAIDARLIMLDEVMAGLNPSEIETSTALIQKINTLGITVLFIEHVMKAVSSLCRRIIVFDDGKFLCEGPTQAVLSDSRVIKAYLGDDYYA